MKLLLLVPHLSTGGLPQVALKRIELLKDDPNVDLYVMEYRQLAWKYVVQRDKIIELMKDRFISLGRHETEEKRDKFEYYFNLVKPDVVHMEEIPEMFMRNDHADYIYRKDRKYKIFETTHTSTFNVDEKRYFPDKFLFVSKYSKELYSKFDIPSEVIEYPIDKINREKEKYCKELKLDPDYFHVLNVGLFTEGKNQGYVFEMAKKLQDFKIQFHFVGNQADNFKDYWEPINKTKTDNCILWGERNDVEKFYNISDLLIFPSKLELNPLVIKEALTYEIPIFMNRLDVLKDTYDNDYLVNYLTGDVDEDVKVLLSKFNIRKKYTNSEDFKNQMIENYIQNKEEIEYKINFVDGAKVELFGDSDEEFDIEFIDKDKNTIEYSTTLTTNTWSKTNSIYYRNWRVVIKKDDKVVVEHDIDLNERNVYIQFDSKSLGDSLAYIPYVEIFRKKHNCNIFCSTFWNHLYEKEYPEINFINPGEDPSIKSIELGLDDEMYAKYSFGWYQPWKNTHNPNDYKKIPLQQTASDILGLEYKEIIPKITIPESEREIEDKYVCLAEFSTANTKHWHYPYKDSKLGWQFLVDWLNNQGYKVMVVSKQPTKLENIINRSGNFPIEHRINQIKHCEFFIGIGSGLSWLAWAMRKKVVMISGFSNPICEFKTNNIRLHNNDVCNSCFNRYEFDRGDWNWCPDHKGTARHFECSTNITADMVINEIKKNNLVEEKVKMNFDDYFVDDIVDEDKIIVEREDNKYKIRYDDGTTSPMNVDIIDKETNKTIQVLSDIKLSNKYTIWAEPDLNTIDKDISFRFYRQKTLLKKDL